MADNAILQPINVREMWEKLVADLASDITPPHNGITSEDIALMLLIHYCWDLAKIDDDRDSSTLVDLCRELGVSPDPAKVTLCLECIEDKVLEVSASAVVKVGCPGYAQKVRELALEGMLWHDNPGCGHYCENHLRHNLSYAITVNGMVRLKCKKCSTQLPMSAIPNGFVPQYHAETLLELYKDLVDHDFFYSLKGHVSCSTIRCYARFCVESPGTYTCGKCSKPFTHK